MKVVLKSRSLFQQQHMPLKSWNQTQKKNKKQTKETKCQCNSFCFIYFYSRFCLPRTLSTCWTRRPRNSQVRNADCRAWLDPSQFCCHFGLDCHIAQGIWRGYCRVLLYLNNTHSISFKKRKTFFSCWSKSPESHEILLRANSSKKKKTRNSAAKWEKWIGCGSENRLKKKGKKTHHKETKQNKSHFPLIWILTKQRNTEHPSQLCNGSPQKQNELIGGIK